MKSTRLINFLKYAFGFCALVFAGLLVWANWEPQTFTQQHVKTSNFVTFDLSATKDCSKFGDAEIAISALQGVTACSINSGSKLAGIMYYTSQISASQIERSLNTELGNDSQVHQKVFEEKASGCPVHGIRDMIRKLKESLRFRS